MRLFPLLLLAISLALTQSDYAQTSTQPVEGLREHTPQVHALRGGTVWLNPRKKMENATLILRDGVIEAIQEAGSDIPKEATVWDMTDKVIYPGFIEAVASPGDPPSESDSSSHWNKLIRPEWRVASWELPHESDIEQLRETGFSSAHQVPEKGIFRGQSRLIYLGEEPGLAEADVLQCLAFERSKNGYPGSLMGVIALVRQTLSDSIWYHEANRYFSEKGDALAEEKPEPNASLAALRPVVENEQTLFLKATDELDYERMKRVADEFGIRQFAIQGRGDEYRQSGVLHRAGVTVVVPVNFPDAPPIEDPAGALEISLERLEHWEFAPSNPAALAESGISICLTSSGMEKPAAAFWKNVRISVSRGLPVERALAALTEVPAELLGVSDRLGKIEEGMVANLAVSDGDLFTDNQSKPIEVWVEGERHELEAGDQVDITGRWELKWAGIDGPESWEIRGTPKSPKLKLGDAEVPLKKTGENVLILPDAGIFGEELQDSGTARLTGLVNREIGKVLGFGMLPGGKSFTWTARISELEPEGEIDEGKEGGEEEEDEGEDDGGVLPVPKRYPSGAFGVQGVPEQPEIVFVRNATVWTSSRRGRLEQADMLVRKGKVDKVGRNLEAPDGAVVIDGKGKHITPGLIDCHSHSAISRGINEGTHAVTCEVRVQDVVDPTDIALYRELAGGLTTANLLHGSANPIGGQNAVIKLRWGSRSASAMLFEGAKPGVKFALGENVKRSNWDDDSGRYPNSRMGVEQIMRDAFRSARDYERSRKEAEDSGIPHRVNLRLEALREMLDGERIIHIHSYRQDEILMFVRLAQEFGFTVGTFQHILEGYKVADALAEIGAGGSSFSDWWAYKFEVYDAIPYNGALLQRAGVVTSFNSDSNELATRLNTEAAKAVKYGGLSEDEALKFVTINPAIQLRIDDRVGSLEPGKDADFVVWNGHPLSSYSRAEQTWIDGRRYFELEADKNLRERAVSERERLIAKALPKRISGLRKKKAKEKLEEDDPENGKTSGRKLTGLDGLLEFRKRSECRTDERGLYHNGQDGHTCSAGCCASKR